MMLEDQTGIVATSHTASSVHPIRSPTSVHDLPFTAPTPDDVDAVTALMRAQEAEATGAGHTTVDDVRCDWSRPSFSLAEDAVTLWDEGVLVAYGEVAERRVWAGVAASHRGRGIGTRLLRWSQQQARDRGWPELGQTLSDASEDAIALLQASGYTPSWESWVFSMPLEGRRHQPTPEGITIRPLRRPDEDVAAHHVIERAFGEWPGRQPTSLEDWLASTIDREDVFVTVAEAGAGPLGVAVCQDEGLGEGWVAQLAVDREQRGRGVGRALLDDAFMRFTDRGCTTAGLSTDSRTGARGLYEDLGMVVTETYRRWTLHLR